MNQNEEDNDRITIGEIMRKQGNMEQKIDNQEKAKQKVDDKQLIEELARKLNLKGKDSDKINEDFQQSTSRQIIELEEMKRNYVELQKQKKIKHISEYKLPSKADSFLAASEIDSSLQQQGVSETYKYLEDSPIRPQLNIGDKYGELMKKSAKNQIEFERALKRGKGFTWYAAKTGRLGVDLYLIAFGVLGFFLVPFFFYERHIKYQKKWCEERGITTDIKDFEAAGFDLDELSIVETPYNYYQQEIKQEKQKRIKLHTEILALTNLLLPNK